ncbi:MAG: hypothetical protein IPK50_00695 [Fibrobacterota bacterium]|nr:MAG: hypothetical protein IPK50_00695 [Fibrobacterota bacterium]
MAEDSDKSWKLEVFAALRRVLESNAASAERELASIAQAYEGETKSSAGDKYETAREMLSQARSMQSRLQDEARSALDWLDRQDLSVKRESISFGALARLPEGWFLVCPFPLQLEVDGQAVRCMSLAGPLGQVLKGARVGEARDFRGKAIEVREVV